MGQLARVDIPRLAEAGGDDHGEHAGDGVPLRLAVLGDSSAAGVGAPDHRLALAGQLAASLAALTGRAISWRVVARSGATARTVRRDLVPRLTDLCSAWQPTLVLVVVGVNDATRLRRPGAFRRDTADLVTAIRTRLGARVPVLLAGLPPVDRFPALPAPVRPVLGAYTRRLDRQLGAVARAADRVYHLRVGTVPVEPADVFAEDGFHPGLGGYRIWGRILAVQTATVIEHLDRG